MERLPGSEIGEIAACDRHETKLYPERGAGPVDPQLILGAKAATACSNDYIEAVPRPTKTHPQIGSSRMLDVVVAGLILLFVLPLMLLCVLAIRLGGSGPAIYRQTRIGHGGRPFTCLKFRTMTVGNSINPLLVEGTPYREEWAALYKLRADPRVTVPGRFMRRYSLDELPQLFNVISGDMSIVGPRPIVADEIHRYGERFADYCKVKPGITGLWQVSGRHALTYDERVRLDAEYSNNKSVRLDLLILWRTIPVVFFGQNE